MIGAWLSEGQDGQLNNHLHIVKYVPMSAKSYIKLPKELQNSAKGLINLKNEDNECLRWCHI